jgi:hypothetical protein
MTRRCRRRGRRHRHNKSSIRIQTSPIAISTPWPLYPLPSQLISSPVPSHSSLSKSSRKRSRNDTKRHTETASRMPKSASVSWRPLSTYPSGTFKSVLKQRDRLEVSPSPAWVGVLYISVFIFVIPFLSCSCYVYMPSLRPFSTDVLHIRSITRSFPSRSSEGASSKRRSSTNACRLEFVRVSCRFMLPTIPASSRDRTHRPISGPKTRRPFS